MDFLGYVSVVVDRKKPLDKCVDLVLQEKYGLNSLGSLSLDTENGGFIFLPNPSVLRLEDCFR